MQAGDEIVKVADGPERLTIAQVDALLYLPEQVAPAARAGAARAGAERGLEGQLPRAARQGRRRHAGAGVARLPAAARRGGPSRERDDQLVPARAGRRRAAPPAAARPVPHAAPAPDAGAPPLVRSYSLSDVPGERRLPDQRQARGRRQPLPARPREGRRRARRRRAARRLRPARRRRARSCCSAPASARRPSSRCSTRWPGERSTRPVWWVHGARNRDEHAFGAEVDELLAALARRATASSPTAGPRRRTPGDYDVAGRLDLAVLDRAGVPKDADYYVCGPDALHARDRRRAHRPRRGARARRDRDLRRRRRLRLRDRQGRRPRAAPAGRRRPAPARPSRSSRSNLAVAVGRTAIASLLDFAEACDVPVGFGCRTRRLPQLRERPARRRRDLPASSRSSRRPTGASSPAAPCPTSELTLDL